MNRRHFLACSTAALIALRMSMANASVIIPDGEGTKIPLWDGVPPGGGGPTGNEVVSAKGALTNVSRPSLRVFKPERPNGKAVLVAAGGGYKRMEMGMEAWPAAQWLTARGFTAYVLSYRLPGEGWADGSKVSLQDAQRALRIIRNREKQVSVLGFSAGGHLLGMAVTATDEQTYAPRDHLDATPAVADAAALIYPIITLLPPYAKTSTHKILVGPHASQTEDARWSVQTRVTPRTPRMFLAQAEDDPISDPANTLIMAAACEHEHVAVEMHRYATGGHGFGLGRPGTPTMKWPAAYEKWLNT
ncbi:alpha/beta hydrolase [Pseudomonas sp. Pseusp122]|uniref:alpha/beta hydrolase n=1 Tax=unclassified Pseudomonas TaxID=196821 RepID=UPI0039A5C0B8